MAILTEHYGHDGANGADAPFRIPEEGGTFTVDFTRATNTFTYAVTPVPAVGLAPVPVVLAAMSRKRRTQRT